MWTRRATLTGGLASLAALAAPRRAQAAVPPADRKLVVVVAYGGWDPTRVFVDGTGIGAVTVERDAAPRTEGGLTWVDHPERPSVTALFTGWGDRAAIVNGLLVPSVSHPACARLLLTGSGTAGAADWATRIGAAARDRFLLPHVVVRGPSYAGALGGDVVRIGTGEAVRGLLDGGLLDGVPGARPAAAVESVVDRFLADHPTIGAPAGEAWSTAAAEWATAHDRLRALKELSPSIAWGVDDAIASQADLAADLLSLGVSRCVTLAHDVADRDSHTDNEAKQSATYEDLFAGLVALLRRLDATAAPSGRPLSEETTVLVVSEMGRTPWENAASGTDHWPHGSALLLGAGVAGGRVVGGFDDALYGLPVDPTTGAPDASGVRLDPTVLGGTLLAAFDTPAEAGEDVILAAALA